MNHSTHEVFSRDDNVVAGSDRSFGMVMAVALAAVTLLNGWHAGRLWPWSGGLAALLLAVALVRPQALNPLNRLWLKFGLLLHRVVNPIVIEGKIGRNEPCPCGSGKKFKRCHLPIVSR